MMSTALWPSSWKRRIFRGGTVWPRWTSKPVGSMPYLTRSGVPVATLRWSFALRASSGTICSTPRRIRVSCSSTLFTARFPLSKEGHHGIHGKHGKKTEEEKRVKRGKKIKRSPSTAWLRAIPAVDSLIRCSYSLCFLLPLPFFSFFRVFRVFRGDRFFSCTSGSGRWPRRLDGGGG